MKATFAQTIKFEEGERIIYKGVILTLKKFTDDENYKIKYWWEDDKGKVVEVD